MRDTQEVLAVKELGDKIGYGNMMEIASALWRRMLKENYGPGIENGAFVTTCLHALHGEDLEITLRSIKTYDNLVNEVFNETKENN